MNAAAQPPVIASNLPDVGILPRQRRTAVGILAAAGFGTVVLFLFDPTRYHFYPLCPLHQTTGLLCPGCGTLRAVHQLTHGNLAAAWRLNPMFVVLLPAGVWLGAREIIWQFTGRRLPGLVTHPFFLWLFVASLVLFGILRNI